jgi:hypothetical protein
MVADSLCPDKQRPLKQGREMPLIIAAYRSNQAYWRAPQSLRGIIALNIDSLRKLKQIEWPTQKLPIPFH